MAETNTPETNPTEYSVPSEKVISEAVEVFRPNRRTFCKTPPNLAARFEECVKPFHTIADKLLQQIVNSDARTSLETYLKNADAKWRIAQATENRYKADSTQKVPTLSHVSSGQFYKTTRIISAGQAAILFNDPDSLPVQYAPVSKSEDYSDEEGKRIAEGQNVYLRYCWDQNDWTTLIKQALRFNCKNGMQLLGMEWDSLREKRPERVPGWYDANGEAVEWIPAKQNHITAKMYDADGREIDPATFLNENGMPTSYVFVEKVREKRNGPVLSTYDLANVFFDLTVDDLQKTPIIVLRDQPTFSELLDMARNGHYENVELLSAAQHYQDESRLGLTTKQDRLDNAGEGTDEGVETALFDRYHIWMIAPIKNGDDPKKAKWDADQIPEIYEAVFVGPFGQIEAAPDKGKPNGTVCLQLRKNPYHHGGYPYWLMHSHPDDGNGLLRMGYYTLLECNIEEQTVTTDQWIDNKTLAIKAPFIGERGNVLQRDNMFSANKVLWVKPGTGKTALTKMEIPNVTQRTLEELTYLKTDADEIVGTLDVYKGQYAGARTSATEVLQVQTQAMKPALEETKFVAVPMLRWIADSVAKLGRQFHDPNKTLAVTNAKGEFVGEVNPALLYGEVTTKITAVDNFEADIAARQLYVNFIQSGGYDRAQTFMGQEGALYFWRMFARRMKFEDPNKIFPESKPYVEAINQAHADYQYMLIDPMGAMNNPNYLPKMGEMHEVHVAVLQPYRDRTQLLLPSMAPDEQEKARQVIQALDLYIMLHEQLKQQEAQTMGAGAMRQLTAGGPQQGQSPIQSNETPAMPGEAQGDIMAGLGGQMAM